MPVRSLCALSHANAVSRAAKQTQSAPGSKRAHLRRDSLAPSLASACPCQTIATRSARYKTNPIPSRQTTATQPARLHHKPNRRPVPNEPTCAAIHLPHPSVPNAVTKRPQRGQCRGTKQTHSLRCQTTATRPAHLQNKPNRCPAKRTHLRRDSLAPSLRFRMRLQNDRNAVSVAVQNKPIPSGAK